MPATLTDFDIFILITVILSALLFIVWLDRYLTRRRSAAINARHLRRVVAEGASIITPITAGPTSFRRQRTLRDSFEQVVGVQFEEFTTKDFEYSDIIVPRKRTLLLPAAA